MGTAPLLHRNLTLACVALTFAAGFGCQGEREVGPIAMRRITAEQYRQTIADVFAPDIKVVGRFEPETRRDGLLAVGTSFVTVTSAGFEQYDAIARRIADQVVAPENRARFVPCTPADATQPDARCAEAFVRKFAARLWRRPLSDEDVVAPVALAESAARSLGDFHGGLRFALSSLLISPEFIFRVERATGGEAEAGRLKLTDHSVAARLSYFFWNTTPDDELLRAAAAGELSSDEGLAEQVDRLLSSPRLLSGVRAFFYDVLGFDELDDVSKDSTLFPRFSRQVLEDAREQTLKLVGDHLVVRDEDFRDLFTTRRSFMTRTLGLVYGVPVRAKDGWEAMEFPETSQRVGLQSHVSLLALHAHPGRSSATLRGIFVREAFMCQEVPAAPADVDFTVVQDVDNPDFKTARERLKAHRSEPGCASCHRLVDPIGLALENFDGVGIWRAEENGVPIDAGGVLEGEVFDGPEGLGRVLHDTAPAAACVVRNVFRYALGRNPTPGEAAFLRELEDDFAGSGYRFPALLRRLAMSDPFRTTSGPRGSGGKEEEAR